MRQQVFDPDNEASVNIHAIQCFQQEFIHLKEKKIKLHCYRPL